MKTVISILIDLICVNIRSFEYFFEILFYSFVRTVPYVDRSFIFTIVRYSRVLNAKFYVFLKNGSENEI